MTAQSASPASGVLLTVDDVRQWKGSLRHIEEEIERLAVERVTIEKKLEAAALFLDVDAVEAAPVAALVKAPPLAVGYTSGPELRPVRRRKRNAPVWADVILDIVGQAEMGLTYAEVRHAASESVLGPKLAQSDKGYHNAIGRLAREGTIKREHGRLFTHSAYERFMAEVDAGRASTSVPQPMAYSPMGEAILDIVGANPGQLNGKGVIGELRKDPEHNATLTPHETGAYNIIARLVRRGHIIRRDDGVLIPGKNFPAEKRQSDQRKGALNGSTASAPFAGGAATLPFDSKRA